MKALLFLTALLNANLIFAQKINLVKDSIMNQRMKSGYADKHFRPTGSYNKDEQRIGAWKDYQVVDDGAYQEVDDAPLKSMGKYLLFGEGKFENGKRVGDWSIYVIEDKTDKKILSEKLSYVEGLSNGHYTYYYPGGAKAEEGSYSDGKIDGAVTIFYREGSIFGKQIYSAGLKEGDQTYFYKSGKINFTIQYKNGKANGKYERWYENGNLKESLTNYEDSIEGMYRYYYPDGKLWTEKQYSHGRLMNVISVFDKNGKELDKGDLKDGNGSVNYYDEDGQIYERATYKDGKEIKNEEIKSVRFK